MNQIITVSIFENDVLIYRKRNGKISEKRYKNINESSFNRVCKVLQALHRNSLAFVSIWRKNEQVLIFADIV